MKVLPKKKPGRRKGQASSPEAIAQRRDKVKRRIVRRIPIPVIAKELEVSERTIEYDIKALREDQAFKLNQMSVEEFKLQMDMNMDELEREAFFLYGTAKNGAEKQKAWDKLLMVSSARLKLYQAVGLLPAMNGVQVNVEQTNINAPQNMIVLSTKLYPYVVSILSPEQKAQLAEYKRTVRIEEE